MVADVLQLKSDFAKAAVRNHSSDPIISVIYFVLWYTCVCPCVTICTVVNWNTEPGATIQLALFLILFIICIPIYVNLVILSDSLGFELTTKSILLYSTSRVGSIIADQTL